MSINFRTDLFDSSMMEMRRNRDHKSLKKICNLCLELEEAIVSFNEDQDFSLTPLYRAEELVNNIRIIAMIMARGTEGINNKQDKGSDDLEADK